MTGGSVPWVGLAAIVAMVTEPWWRRLLEVERQPRRRVDVPPGVVPARRSGPARGDLTRRVHVTPGQVRELPPYGPPATWQPMRELEDRGD